MTGTTPAALADAAVVLAGAHSVSTAARQLGSIGTTARANIDALNTFAQLRAERRVRARIC